LYYNNIIYNIIIVIKSLII